MEKGAIEILKKHGCLFMKDDYKNLFKDLEDYYRSQRYPQVYKFDETCFSKSKENLERYELNIGMHRKKEEQRMLYQNSNGVNGRYWLECSPSWIKDKEILKKTEYPIFYFVNDGDHTTFGWFTVEEIQEWFDNPKIFLHELGGTKGR